MNLQQYDLNLLIIFDMIFREGNLTRAGEKLTLSQPAVSQALGRLRDAFDDSLFVRSGNEMVPTARANLIAPQIRQILHLAENTFQDRGKFDPAKSDRTFRLAMSDYTEMVLMPALFKELQSKAPFLRIESRHLSAPDYQTALSRNDLDLILASCLEFGPNTFRQSLFGDREVVVVKGDSPVLKEPLTTQRYASYKHAQFNWVNETNTIDLALEEMGLTRRIILEVQHEMVLPLILRDNEIVVNMPERMARVFKELIPLEILHLPMTVPEYTFHQHWHERNHHDPAHRWMRETIKTVAESLAPL